MTAGGKRAGAGRPRKAPRVHLSVSVDRDTFDLIQALAKRRGWGRLIDRWAMEERSKSK